MRMYVFLQFILDIRLAHSRHWIKPLKMTERMWATGMGSRHKIFFGTCSKVHALSLDVILPNSFSLILLTFSALCV